MALPAMGKDASVRAFNAGVDIDMGSRTDLDYLGEGVKSGAVLLAPIDDAVRKILTVKYQMGLFEHPFGDPERLAKISLAPEHRQAARQAAQRSAVLADY